MQLSRIELFVAKIIELFSIDWTRHIRVIKTEELLCSEAKKFLARELMLTGVEKCL